VYGVEWLIVLALIGLAAGGGIGYLLANRGSGGKRQLESDLQAARQELQDYRQAVVSEFSDTARKFQTLNDAYRDLHEQLARSSSALCGDITGGPLLEAPAGHQDVIPADVRDRVLSATPAAATEADPGADPYDDDEIRVAEPPDAVAAAAAPADAGAVTGDPAAPASGAEADATAPPAGDQPAPATGEEPVIQRREAAAG